MESIRAKSLAINLAFSRGCELFEDMIKFPHGTIALQGGKPPDLLKSAFVAVPFGIIPLWEIQKKVVVIF